MAQVRIRQALGKDLPFLVSALGQERYFATQLARQHAGHGVLLVAWQAFNAVGDVYLWLSSAEEPELRDRLPGVPLLTHLEVSPAHRNRRIGTQLVHEAEERLRTLGHERVALGVEPGNVRVRRLYHRLGYAEWPYPPILTTRHVFHPDGRIEEEAETCHILVKSLREARAQ
ncbi:GNAT family N-acetyltransferase [Nonomuraea sp. NN258]|uniref:GNAT family N-acetyltransferase n=1 Tax=Nonomuraea antri TaxID=2730852 RepID=UPI0015690B9D|nr:GNAT family N-acetyltransferase [Nonomuraea antri]NRQ37604.1 GNAT family N-acetyltransferase [Nonomuraea antri]